MYNVEQTRKNDYDILIFLGMYVFLYTYIYFFLLFFFAANKYLIFW